MYEIKTKQNENDVIDYIKNASDGRENDAIVLLELMKKITNEEPKMWGETIIGFGVYKYKYESGHCGECAKIGFSLRKQYITIYLPIYIDKEELFLKLGKYKNGKGCLYIKTFFSRHGLIT